MSKDFVVQEELCVMTEIARLFIVYVYLYGNVILS